jgi:hypothetical protein
MALHEEKQKIKNIPLIITHSFASNQRTGYLSQSLRLGTPPQNLFFFFYAPPQAAREEE